MEILHPLCKHRWGGPQKRPESLYAHLVCTRNLAHLSSKHSQTPRDDIRIIFLLGRRFCSAVCVPVEIPFLFCFVFSKRASYATYYSIYTIHTKSINNKCYKYQYVSTAAVRKKTLQVLTVTELMLQVLAATELPLQVLTATELPLQLLLPRITNGN